MKVYPTIVNGPLWSPIHVVENIIEFSGAKEAWQTVRKEFTEQWKPQ